MNELELKYGCNPNQKPAPRNDTETLQKYRYDMNPYRNTPRLPNGAYRAEKARK